MRYRKSRILLLIISLAAVSFLLFAAIGVLGMGGWTDLDIARITDCDRSSVIYDVDDAELLRLHGSEDRLWIKIDTLPKHVKMAFVSAEDARFFEHEGIDVIRIGGALIADIKAGAYVQGASTITQQLIKLSHLTSEKTISRKLEEAILACEMERQCSKEEILEMYLNYVYFGGGYYGIEAAALGYFGVSASGLSVSQGAMLAGILKAPSHYAPHLDYEASMGRRDTVLTLMRDYGYITDAQMLSAEAERPQILRNIGTSEEYSGYYTDAVIEDAARALGISEAKLKSGGYRIYSAMDRQIQTFAEAQFENNALFPTENCEAALVVQQAKSGLILAMVGGRAYEQGGFNRATDIRRQPGSVIKPVLAYAPALEYIGYTAATMVLDEATTFADYSPDNYGSKFYGWVTVREAVTRSLNIPAVKILSEVGVERAKSFAKSVGIPFDATDSSLALVLGGFKYGVSPRQVAGAYSSFASCGEYSTPSTIRYITDSSGKLLYSYQPEHAEVMSAQNAYILTSMLQSVITDGTGHRLAELNIPVAGKTGTVGAGAGNRDAWMATYTPDYTAVVWMGYDSDNVGTLPQEATGGRYPALMLYELYSAIYKERGAGEFTVPEGVKTYSIDSYALSLNHEAVLSNALTPAARRMEELFTDATAPEKVTTYWSVPSGAKNLTVTEVNGLPMISFVCPDAMAVYTICRSENGAEKIIKSLEGGSNAEYVDITVLPGHRYTYRVTVRRTEPLQGGRYVYGPASDSVEFIAKKTVKTEHNITIGGNAAFQNIIC